VRWREEGKAQSLRDGAATAAAALCAPQMKRRKANGGAPATAAAPVPAAPLSPGSSWEPSFDAPLFVDFAEPANIASWTTYGGAAALVDPWEAMP